jgi:hypothetical protein
MTALERDILAWTKAKLRHTAALFDPRVPESERSKMWREQLDAEVALLEVGTKLLTRRGREADTKDENRQ